MCSYNISVIMPVYNQEKYLRTAVDSILAQTYPWMEMILIDDGSTDASLSIMNEYAAKDRRFSIISRENRGLVSSLNEGIKCAKGNIISRMDADDYSYPQRFEKQIALLDRNPDLFLVGTNFELIYDGEVSEETKRIKNRFLINVNEPVGEMTWKEDIWEDYKILHSTWLIRKELFENIGKYKEYCAEDVEFLFRTVCHSYRVGKVAEVLFSYRIREDSKSVIEAKEYKHKQEINKYKMEYVAKSLELRMNTLSYYIWGADLTGEITQRYMHKNYPSSKCIAFVDSVKAGDFLGYPIILPEKMNLQDGNYVFIATNGGRKQSIAYMKSCEKKVERDYFKVI